MATGSAIAQQIKKEVSVDKYRAVHWGLEHGLSQACVLHMLKDVNGFLWIGTQGELSRFDGSVFKNYYYDPKKTGTIEANATYGGLIEDSLHNIWIGTNKDLYRYDIKADSFTRFLNAAPLGATTNEIFCIARGGSIFTYNIRSFEKKTLATLVPADSIWAGLGLSYSFVDKRSNSLWMLRGDHSNDHWSGGGLLQISLTTGEKRYYSWNCYKNIPGHDHSAESMCYDSRRNCLWINSSEGLMQFTLDDQRFHYTGALNSFFSTKEYRRWVGISLDLQGRVWLATMQKGIVIYDPSDHSVELPFADSSEMQKQISDANACIYADRDGILWSGFWLGKGIYQVLPFSPSVKHYKTDTSTFRPGTIINFQNAGNGKMWIGSTEGRPRVFDTSTGNDQALTENDLPPDLKRTAIIPLWIDTIANKAILFCFAKGYWLMDINTKKYQPLIFKDAANHEIIISQLRGTSQFKDGLLISAIQNNTQRIFFVTSESMVAHETVSFPIDPGNAFYLEMTDDSFMFLKGSEVTGNRTYTFRNNKWIQTPIPLDSIRWSHIIYNKKDQGYWVVSEKQLIHYGKDFRIIHTYTPAEGLPDINIYSLLPDSRGNIWFNTDRSIHQLNIETGVFSTLSEKDGFHPQNFSVDPAIYMGADSNLYLGGGVDGNGFVRISPDKYTNTPSSVYIKSLEVNQKPFPLPTAVNILQELSLRYFQNKVTIETGIIDYYSKGSSHIRYKIEGTNDNWQYAPANYAIRYDGLQPGSYTLLMQSSNAANEFIGPVKSLIIHISPPWWNTWWFRVIAIILIGAIFYGLIRWRLQQRFSLQLERSEKETQLADMRQKTAELKQQSTELEMQALRAQMNPHFIFNSLNSINRFILQNNRQQASEYLTKFSKLVRMILQNSQSPLIPLESELESLGLYLEMEALRFNYHFDYKISVPKDLDIEMLKVPPLILQPYVENAIWHGLMHKEEKGQLNIDVLQEGDHLYFKITDNGIGRKKASEIASKSSSKHKSMGLKITANRIAMLQYSNGEESPVKINDLVETDGTASGTQVVIKMPVIETD